MTPTATGSISRCGTSDVFEMRATQTTCGRSVRSKVCSGTWRDLVIGGHLGTAASTLGRIARYPNTVLAQTLEGAPDGRPGLVDDEDLVQFIRTSAYGAYIMTGTDFQTGFDAGVAFRNSGQVSSLERAERVIAAWRAWPG